MLLGCEINKFQLNIRPSCSKYEPQAEDLGFDGCAGVIRQLGDFYKKQGQRSRLPRSVGEGLAGQAGRRPECAAAAGCGRRQAEGLTPCRPMCAGEKLSASLAACCVVAECVFIVCHVMGQCWAGRNCW